MKTRWYLVLALGLGVALLLVAWYGQTAWVRSWETRVAPTDKPAVNFVISFRGDGAPFLKRVWLCAEEPRSGKLIKRVMDFNARSVGHNKIEFELKEDPRDIRELALPPTLDGSFKAKLRSKSTGATEELHFDEVR